MTPKAGLGAKLDDDDCENGDNNDDDDDDDNDDDGEDDDDDGRALAPKVTQKMLFFAPLLRWDKHFYDSISLCFSLAVWQNFLKTF